MNGTSTATEIDVDSFADRLRGALVVDVREPHEYVAGHVPGAVSVPLGDLDRELSRLPRRGTVYVVCASGNRSMRAAHALAAAGIPAVSVAGGTGAWLRSGRAVVTGTSAN